MNPLKLLAAIQVALLAGLVGSALSAHAETYNFYFDTRSLKNEAQAPKAESNFERNHRWSAAAGAFYGNRDAQSAGGMLGAANFAVAESLRLEAFAGAAALAPSGSDKSRSFGGGEIQVLPLHFAGSSRRTTDLGLSLGMSNFHTVGSNPVSLHVGPTVSARLSRPCALVGSVRANLGSVLFDAGLSFRL